MTDIQNQAIRILNRFLSDKPEAKALQVNGLIRFALVFLQGVFLVKGGVGTALVGQIEFLLFVVNFLSFFFLNGGRNAILSFGKGKDLAFETGERVSAAFITFHGFAVVACLVLFALFQINSSGELSLLTHGSVAPYLGAFLFFIIASGPMEYAYVIRGQYNRMILVSAVFQMLQLIAVVYPLVSSSDLTASLAGLAAVSFVRWIFCLVDLGWWRGKQSWQAALAFSAFAIPLVLHSFMGGVMDYVDNWIVSVYFEDAQFAIYRYGARELPLNMLLIGGLTGGLIHRFRQRGNVSVVEIKAESAKLIRLLFPLTSILILVSPWLFTLVYSDEFALSARVFNIYAFTLLARVVLNQVVMYHEKQNWLLVVASGVEVILNIGLSLWLLQTIGILGIPLATVVAYALHRLALAAVISARHNLKLGDYLPTKMFLLYSLGMVLCFFISEWIHTS